MAALGLKPEQVKALADPATGVGADQVIAMEKTLRGDVFMRIWNKDGSSAEACGNATRCVAWLVMEETGKDKLVIETVAGKLKADRLGPTQDLRRHGLAPAQVGRDPARRAHGHARHRSQDRPDRRALPATPRRGEHGQPAHHLLRARSRRRRRAKPSARSCEWHPLFPQGVNVGFLEVLSRTETRLRTWERNAGQTLACGSNNCAAIVAAARRNLTDRKALVHNDGGDIEIEWSEATDHVIMTGPIELEYVSEV